MLVGIVAPSPELAELQAALVGHLVEQGIEVSEYTQPEAFIAHVTLAYGEGLTSEVPAMASEVVLLAYNVTLATPEQVIQSYSLQIESEEALMTVEQGIRMD